MNVIKTHENLMARLAHKHEYLLKIIDNKPIYYLDIPIHSNIGDHLIMQGSLKFFQKNNIRVKHIASAIDFQFPKLEKNIVIILHGGGNLGDLYDLHQQFRKKIIQTYPDNRIIIFPQTIHFESNDNYMACCQQYTQHKDLHICLRDKNSYQLALNMSKNIYLIPDMAHSLYPIKSCTQPLYTELFLKRNDKESNSSITKIEVDTTIDWDNITGKYGLYIIKKFFKTLRFSKRYKIKLLRTITIRLWIKYSEFLTHRAIKLFSKYENVLTDRLHAHLLSCLMNKKNIVLDNSYGKNYSYIQLWTLESPYVMLYDGNDYIPEID